MADLGAEASGLVIQGPDPVMEGDLKRRASMVDGRDIDHMEAMDRLRQAI